MSVNPADEPCCSEAGHTHTKEARIESNETREREFEGFLRSFVQELNYLSREDGAVVLVEGKRDLLGLKAIGYTGRLVSIAELHAPGHKPLLAGATLVIILTDLDREGRQLAARYRKTLSHEGFQTSLEHRRRLSQASRGTFLHIENLRRFAHIGYEAIQWRTFQSLYKGQM